ncbi:receptor-like protein 35 [Gastrolobium bilobum]|uniref:receptor-like protein 35 n=1 Tax=Gastrolobium bilobum TaxID=150636 RepID=UPI002AB27FEC|nr:receptor-like protein 35 [Gastrolobium bilobum]
MKIHKVLPFFIPLCLINFNIIIHAATSQCLDHQQLLLTHLKDNLIFNPARSKKLVHWNQSGDCCQWNGVACNNKGHVVGLDLSEESISGGLDNSSLFNMQYLLNLNLALNDFGSLIPLEIVKLENLRYLNLSFAGFQGQIPSEISHLTKLVTLDLSTSFASHHTLKLERPNMQMLLQNLTEIAELYLDGVRVSAEGEEWCHALYSLQKLQVLSMSSCNLLGPIDSSLATLKALSIIRLNLNNISSPVPKFFANFSNLKVMELRSCRLSGCFPKDIFQIQTLTFLDISDNQDLHGFLPNFLQGVSLQTMNFSNTIFNGILPGAISNLKQLSTLDLSNCQFNGTLPTSMSELTQLVHLDLSYNMFTGPLPSFQMSRNLRYLSLLQNNLTGAIPSSHLEGLVNLLTINLGNNSLNGKVPPSLFTLPSLQELTLSHNKFDGLLDEFPNASSSKLQLVDLSSNELQGRIPVSIFQLKGIRFLQLSANDFNGTSRLDMFRRMQSLHTLGLSNNQLSVDITFNDDHGLLPFPTLKYLLLASCKLGEFPGFLRNQSQLNALDLSNNQIHGTIPNWIWRFDTLAYLNLSNNFLTNLEGPFEDLNSNLYILDLHSNQLQGSTPIFTKYAVHLDFSSNRFNITPPNMDKYIPSVFFFSLSNNSLQGNIHESFCKFSTLRLLDLSHNSFSGSIPKCLTRMNSTLRVLNLAGNKLTGYISDTISSSCNLRFLDLNENLLGGVIPISLANCQRLQVLNLGNNLFSDRFPCFLGNISTLRVLILRSNRLHGPIACGNSTGNWEMLHIVDLASNNLTGTLPGSLLTSWTKMIGCGDESHEKYGALFFEMFDNLDILRYSNLFLAINIDLVKRLGELLASEPYTVADHIFSYYITANEFGGRYLDSVIVVNKGLQMKLIQIPTIFTSLDLSFNHFKGPIPEELVNLRALNVLNLSHNAFSSHIPSSFGNLKHLESLDLSNNNLSGEIPAEFASLTFLAYLNLSFNHLVGKIPNGAQMETFDASSFEGNEGLCGTQIKACSHDGMVVNGPSPPTPTHEKHSSIEWNFLSVELGFIFGIGMIIFPLIFLKKWRVLYWKHVDDLLYKVVSKLDFVYEQHRGQKYRTLRWMA